MLRTPRSACGKTLCKCTFQGVRNCLPPIPSSSRRLRKVQEEGHLCCGHFLGHRPRPEVDGKELGTCILAYSTTGQRRVLRARYLRPQPTQKYPIRTKQTVTGRSCPIDHFFPTRERIHSDHGSDFRKVELVIFAGNHRLGAHLRALHTSSGSPSGIRIAVRWVLQTERFEPLYKLQRRHQESIQMARAKTIQ